MSWTYCLRILTIYWSSHGDIPSAASKFQVASFEDSESPAKNQKKSDRREGALESVHSDYNFQAQDVSARSLLSKNKKGLEQFQQNDTRYTTQTPQADSSLEERFRRLEDMLQEESIRRPMREKEDRHGSLRSDSEVNKKTHDSVPMATHESKENADILQKIQSLLYSAPKEEMKEKRKPIRLKDAIGRKFSFPYELCKTWSVCNIHFSSYLQQQCKLTNVQGMADLIQEAFLHIDAIGPHVAEGHYDLLGPSNEIILPKTWESVIEPDWAITMHMWPMPEPQPQETTVNEPRRSFEDPLPRRRKRPGHDLPSPPHLPFRPPPPDPQYNGEQAPKSKKKVRSKKSAGVLLTPSAHHTTVDDMPAYDFGQHLRDRSPRSKLSSASSVGATNSRVESDRISDDIVEVIEHEGPFADIPETTLPDAEGVEEDETVPSSTAWATDGESEHTPGSTTDMSELNEAHPQLVDDILESSADD